MPALTAAVVMRGVFCPTANAITVRDALCHPARRGDDLSWPGIHPASRRILGIHVVNDTVRIKRPFSCRRQQDLGGRTTQDLLGNSVKVRTRAQESEDEFDGSLLEHTLNLKKGEEG
jgi:hypothetical protein